MQAGRRELLRRAATRQIGASGPRFPSLLDVGREYSRAATHVDSCDERLSDAGSTPAASTSPRFPASNGRRRVQASSDRLRNVNARLPGRRLVVLQELPPYVRARVETGDDWRNDAGAAVDGVERRMKALLG